MDRALRLSASQHMARGAAVRDISVHRRVIAFALTATLLFAASCDDPQVVNQSLGASIDDGNVVLHIVLCPGERVTYVSAVEVRGQFIDKRDPVVWEISSEQGAAVSRIGLGVVPDGFTEDEPYVRPTSDQNPLSVTILTNIEYKVGPVVGFRMDKLKEGVIHTNQGNFDPPAFADRGAERCHLMAS